MSTGDSVSFDEVAIKCDGQTVDASVQRQVLIQVWKEACQHIELADAVARDLPAPRRRACRSARLAVRELDLARRAVETLAAAPQRRRRDRGPRAVSSAPTSSTRSSPGAAAVRSSTPRPARSGGASRDSSRTAWRATCSPARSPRPRSRAASCSWSRRRGRSLRATHTKRVGSALLEPFAAALENDRRLRALAAVREAAQADRAALLSRLGRTEITDTVVGAEAGLASRDGARRARRGPRRARARARRDRLGQGGRGARDPRALAPRRTGPSCA